MPTKPDSRTRPDPDGLTPKERAFVESYLGDARGNAAKAARQAGYPEDSARQVGYELLTKPDIANVVRRRSAEMVGSADRVLAELTSQAFFDATLYFVYGDDGSVAIDLKRLADDGHGHLVQSIKYDRQGRTIVQWADKQQALQLLGRHLQLFADRLKVETDRPVAEMTDEELAAIVRAGRS